MTNARLLATLAGALGLAGCMDCSQAGCVAQLELDVTMAPAAAPTVEVCRDGACYGPAELAAAPVTMVFTDDLYMQASLSEEGGVATVGVPIVAWRMAAPEKGSSLVSSKVPYPYFGLWT